MKKVYSFILITVFSASVFGQTVPSYVPTNGLVGWWPFNGNANDESGNGNNGTVNGATLTTDRFGNAGRAYLFGTNKFIDLGSAGLSNNPNNCSFSAWYKIDSPFLGATPNSVLLTKRHADGGTTWTTLMIGPDSLPSLVVDFPSINRILKGGGSSFNSQWNHIVGVKIGNRYTLYHNGQLIKDSIVNIIQTGSNYNMFVGKHGAWNSFFNGKIDDIGIWNRALTQAEITALYTANGVGIKDQSLNQLSIYPNPAKTQITLNATTNQIGKTLKVYDALGKVVYETILKQQQYNINITNWANGIYTVAIPEQGLTYKFVKE